MVIRKMTRKIIQWQGTKYRINMSNHSSLERESTPFHIGNLLLKILLPAAKYLLRVASTGKLSQE